VEYSGSGALTNGVVGGDVDIVRLSLEPGSVLRAFGTQAVGSPVVPIAQIFDADGNLLSAQGIGDALYTSPIRQDVFVAISDTNNQNFNPSVAATGTAAAEGAYEVTMRVTVDRGALVDNNRVEITGGYEVSVSGAPLRVDGAIGSRGIPIFVNISMSADQVAAALQLALANQFSNGDTDAFPVTGSQLRLAGFPVTNAEIFSVTGGRYGDQFGSNGTTSTNSNSFEGAYFDDVIIGFAERGERVTGPGGGTDQTFVGTGAVPTTGTYQLEIRDASEYIASRDRSLFRTFDTNDRLGREIQIVAPDAVNIVQGSTFQLSDGNTLVTFEFVDIDAGGTATPGNVAVPYSLAFEDPETQRIDPLTNQPVPGSGEIRPMNGSEVADAIIAAINSPAVRSLVEISAAKSSGVDTVYDERINLFGNVEIVDGNGVLAAVNRSTGRGDQNRDRESQGIVIVENSRFLFNESYGIDISHNTFGFVDGVPIEQAVRYQRNLIELNTENLVTGAVVQSNTLAFNGDGGIRISGIDEDDFIADESLQDPVPFDRILNNTIIGGSISPGSTTEPQVFAGLLFEGGVQSFADSVIDYNPNRTGGPVPGGNFQNANNAIGVPQNLTRGAEPEDGTTTVSLGAGGSITLGFTDNVLIGSGDASPDLVVFETGEVESVLVEISRDGQTFFDVGFVGGNTNRVDIDAFGYGPQDRFAFVRLTDLRQGTATTGPVGADIDAVGVLSSAPIEIYTSGGTGIELVNNASPTLLNNVIVNSATAVAAGAQATPVLGGNTFYRNDTDVTGPITIGQFAQQIADAESLFVNASELVFTPSAGASTIDSSVDSLEDRNSLAIVRQAVGLPQSPILAPRIDGNGQLRVDDPGVETPSGLGENVFVDRGAEDRFDDTGPRAILLNPRAASLGTDSGVVQAG
ncbi:MAG: hypothetical protein AAFP90_13355, partial [Planctomycetota bacterium]